ncbi:hypothetical protein H6G72_00100 [Planktothricoides sp. FACHB-1370]|uniref:Guanylate cyclase domain-containing protein n=1 Tax=Planktothricoides raciborskii FACHB-1370 TaxID=2949576 RepID=A0ABR8E6U8_9CYAN|nr:hypothetical protein [Planktothricoides raciborskii FACHB-1370]MBD2581975.1 hypothetical protein [Planktothricoides raciborskii FACHB-1261]
MAPLRSGFINPIIDSNWYGLATNSNEKLRYQQENTETLLLNISPKLIAQRLKQNPGLIADNFESVTVMFANIVGFTNLSAQIYALELVKLLNEIFSRFDALAQRHKLEKIKTIGLFRTYGDKFI